MRAMNYQRCLYFILAGRGIVQMLEDLDWLEDLLEARGRVAGNCSKRRAPVMPQVRPYVAGEPDGPLVAVTPRLCARPVLVSGSRVSPTDCLACGGLGAHGPDEATVDPHRGL